MATITKKEIKKLLKEIRDDLEEKIGGTGEAQNSSGNPIDVDIKIEIGEIPPPAPVVLASDEPTAFARCLWICYTVNAVRTCELYCY